LGELLLVRIEVDHALLLLGELRAQRGLPAFHAHQFILLVADLEPPSGEQDHREHHDHEEDLDRAWPAADVGPVQVAQVVEQAHGVPPVVVAAATGVSTTGSGMSVTEGVAFAAGSPPAGCASRLCVAPASGAGAAGDDASGVDDGSGAPASRVAPCAAAFPVSPEPAASTPFALAAAGSAPVASSGTTSSGLRSFTSSENTYGVLRTSP